MRPFWSEQYIPQRLCLACNNYKVPAENFCCSDKNDRLLMCLEHVPVQRKQTLLELDDHRYCSKWTSPSTVLCNMFSYLENIYHRNDRTNSRTNNEFLLSLELLTLRNPGCKKLLKVHTIIIPINLAMTTYSESGNVNSSWTIKWPSSRRDLNTANLDLTVKTDCGWVVFYLDYDGKFCLPTNGQQTGTGVYSNQKLSKKL